MRTKIKTLIDKSLLQTNNIVMNTLFALIYKRKPIISRNASLKNKHKGETCVIFGNGPSLRNFDTTVLKGKKLFAVNYFFENPVFPDLVPDYYVVIDEILYIERYPHMLRALEKYPSTSFLLKSKSLKNRAFQEIINKSDRIFISFNQKALIDDNIQWDLTCNVTASVNVINHCIQSAIYMGFETIYLAGCDFNSFTSSKQYHFYETGGEKTISLGDELKFYAEVCYHHYALNRLAQKLGIRIINATPGSLLDAYERIDKIN